jgi:hypothetical protein
MKSDMTKFLLPLLPAIGLLVTPGLAQEKPGCEIAMAALTLPDGSTGLVHVRDSETTTKPLQLSTRYFSERLDLPGNVIQIFKDPLVAKPSEPQPQPLLTLQIPAETRLAYAVLWSETDDKNSPVWKGRVFNAKGWDRSSLKVLNATTEPLGIRAGTKEIMLNPGKSTDFSSSLWSKPFPAKIYRLKPEQKNIFSSTWQVNPGSRELCFLFGTNQTVSLRSILEITPAENSTDP